MAEKPRAARRLHSMIIKEISAVPEGANEDARIEIVKARTPPQETDMADTNDDVRDEDFDGDDEIELTEEQYDELADELHALNEAGELVPAFAAMLMSLEEAGEVVTKMGEDLEAQGEVIAKLRSSNEAIRKQAIEQLEEIEKRLNGGEAETEDERILKGMTPEARAQFIEMRKAHEASETEKVIAKVRAYGVGDPKVIAPILQRLRKSNAADADALEGVLKAAGAAIAKGGLTRPLGHSALPADSAIAKARALAEDIRKERPTLTREQALNEVWEREPGLYEDVRAEQARAA